MYNIYIYIVYLRCLHSWSHHRTLPGTSSKFSHIFPEEMDVCIHCHSVDQRHHSQHLQGCELDWKASALALPNLPTNWQVSNKVKIAFSDKSNRSFVSRWVGISKSVCFWKHIQKRPWQNERCTPLLNTMLQGTLLGLSTTVYCYRPLSYVF